MAEFPTLEDIFEPIEGKAGTEANEQMRLWYSGTRQLPGASPPEAITIIDDVIAPTRADVIVDTEGQAPADDLQIIKTDSTHDGMILTLRAANASRTVAVRSTGQLNGIALSGGISAHTLSTTEQLTLQRDGNVWREIRGTMPTATLANAAESTTLPATTPSTLSALLQTVRNCLKWILARMDFRTAEVTIYVRKDGNNSNAGFTNSAAGAVADWDGVETVLQKLNMKNANVTVAFQAGTWGGRTFRSNTFAGVGGGSLIITGLGSSTILGEILVYDCLLHVENISIHGALQARYGGTIYASTTTFIGTATPGAALHALDGGHIYHGQNITFSGIFTYGFLAAAHGSIRLINTISITFKDNCTFNNQFLAAGSTDGPGKIHVRGVPAYTGTFTGKKYYMYSGSMISGISQANMDAIPGTIAGTLSGGSSFIQSSKFVSSGTSSASGYLLADGTDLSAALAPLPKTASGVGQLVLITAASGAALSLPSGGTWAYILFSRDTSVMAEGYDALRRITSVGVAAGGTVIQTAAALFGPQAVCWRIA